MGAAYNNPSLNVQLDRLTSLVQTNTQLGREIKNEKIYSGRLFALGFSKIKIHLEIAKTILSIRNEIHKTKNEKLKNEFTNLIFDNIESKKAGNIIKLAKTIVKLYTGHEPKDIVNIKEYNENCQKEFEIKLQKDLEFLQNKMQDIIIKSNNPELSKAEFDKLNKEIKELTDNINELKSSEQRRPSTVLQSPKDNLKALANEYKTSGELFQQIARDLSKEGRTITLAVSGNEQKGLHFNIPAPPQNINEKANEEVFDNLLPKEFKAAGFTKEEEQHIASLSLAVSSNTSLKLAKENFDARFPDKQYQMQGRKTGVEITVKVEGERKFLESSFSVNMLDENDPDTTFGRYDITYTYNLNDLDELPKITRAWVPNEESHP